MKKRALSPFFFGLFASAVSLSASAQTQSQSPAGQTRPRIVATATPSQTTQTPAPTTQQQPPRQSAPANAAPAPTPNMLPAANPPGSTPPVTATLPAASPTTNGAGVVAVPSYSTAAPLQPAHTLALGKVRQRIGEAQRLLKTRLTPTASTSPSLYLVTLAALDPDTSQIHLLTLPKQTFITRGSDVALTTSLGMNVRLRVVRPNYVNTAVIVSDMAGRQLTPLLLEYPIEKGGIFREMAYYTSAHPALASTELIKTGQAYVHTMIDLAARRLHDKGFDISPEILDIAERLCIVEHVDHDRFRLENRIAIYEEIYTLYALNEIDTYRYSVSTAGAGGMVQMIPWTYQMLRQRYPAVGLNPDFVAGMRNHGNALEAMLLYIKDTWRDLQLDPDVSYAMSAKLATQAELIAAGYNSNPARLGGYIRRGGTSWRTLIPRETQMYLQIYKSFESLVPLKTRSDKSAS